MTYSPGNYREKIGKSFYMAKQPPKDAYTRLKKDLISLIPDLGDDVDPAELDSKSLREMKSIIESVTGLSKPITEKTLRKYFRATEYDHSFNNISFLAAVWLCEKARRITKEECKEFYRNEIRTSSHYYNEYLKAITEESSIEEPGTVPPTETKRPVSDELTLLDPLFNTPDFDQVFERTVHMDALFELTNRRSLVVVDGISGVGKKHLVRSLQNKLLASGRYERILWKYIEKNYSLETFINEVNEKLKFTETPFSSKAQQFVEFLKTNQVLVVFYGVENADEASFEDFFKNIALGSGNSQILLIRNTLKKFPFIAAKNLLPLNGYSLDELTSLFEQRGLPFSDSDAISFIQISDGLPFYIDLMINASTKARNKEDHLSITALSIGELEYKVKEWCQHLNDHDKNLLHLLSILQIPFTGEEVNSLGAKIGLENVDQSFKSLRDCHIVKMVSNNRWKIIGPVALYFRTKYDVKENARLHEIIGDHLSICPSPSLLKRLDQQHLSIQSDALTHYILAAKFEKSSPYLDPIIILLKKFNLYPKLYELLKLEIANNPGHDHWIKWHFAHCCFLMGHFQECNTTLTTCIDLASRWFKDQKQQPEPGIPFFIKTFQLFSELVDETIPGVDAKALLINVLSLFYPTELIWNIRAHALSVLSGYFEKKAEYTVSKSINENLLKEDYDGTTQSKAVTYTHLGIVQYGTGNYPSAEEWFTKAINNFNEAVDFRGLAWSMAYLVLCKIKQGQLNVNEEINTILAIRREGKLFDPEYKNWLALVKAGLQDDRVKSKMEAELETVTTEEKLIVQNTPADSIQRTLKEVKDFLNRVPKDSFVFESFINPVSETDYPLDSKLKKSMRKKIRRDPFSYLEKIQKKDPGEIFSSEKDNKTIIECLNFYEFREKILKDLVLPNLQYIIDLDEKFDDSKTGYARELHNAGDQDNALKLLAAVNEKNQLFLYLNTKANCLRKTGRKEESETYYEMAAVAAKTNKEKGIHFHNIAFRIYEDGLTQRYQEAKDNCLKSIEYREEEKRFIRHPISTLVLLEIATADMEDVVFAVSQLKAKYSISDGWLSNIFRNIKSSLKRDRLLKEFFKL
jgi:tetratricopeptide (TPR) repeat protein